MDKMPPKAGHHVHKEVAGRPGEGPAEKTLRHAMNDHSKALEQMQKGGEAMPSQYPLNQDGEEDQ